MVGDPRAQSNLLALAIAVLLLTAAIGVALTVAGAPFHPHTTTATDRHHATGAAATLIAADSPITRRAGVLNASALRTVTAAGLREILALPPDTAVRVSFEGRTLADTGPIDGGATTRRIVTVTRWEWSRSAPMLGEESTFTIGPTPMVKLGVNASNTTVETVLIDGRVVLHNPDGVSTPVVVALPPGEAVTVTVTTRGAVTTGDIWVATPTVHSETGVLVVTVDG